MPRDINGRWYPDIFPKQLDVFNSRVRALLVSGPRLSGKTRGVLHRVVRHLWETKGARVGMFTRILKTSKQGGTWSLLNNVIIPEWIASGIGMVYTTENKGVYGPKTDGSTRVPYFRVRNAFGGESELHLFSLDNDSDAEEKLKEMEFSMIYFSELDKFGDRRVLTVALPSLRMGHLKYEEQMWIADCNPSEEGEQSWIYRMFYQERNMQYDDYVKYAKENDLPIFEQKEFHDFYHQLDVIEILPSHNPRVDARQLQEVKIGCGSDQGLYARHVLGRWVWGGGDASRHFRAHFKPKHIVGYAGSSDESEWEYLNPAPDSTELITGWDLGDRYHAAVILDKVIEKNRSKFLILDEAESLGEDVSNEEFTGVMMEKIEAIEATMGKDYSLERAWSDRSSIERYSATGDTYPYAEVYAASDGRIFLRGTPKAKGSVRTRVKMLKDILANDRLLISAHCSGVQRMLRNLKKGSTELDYVVHNEDKHIFDALTYALMMEMAEELEAGTMNFKPGRRSAFVGTSIQ